MHIEMNQKFIPLVKDLFAPHINEGLITETEMVYDEHLTLTIKRAATCSLGECYNAFQHVLHEARNLYNISVKDFRIVMPNTLVVTMDASVL